MIRNIAVLGSTGSIGTQTLDVVAQHPELFRVVALAAGGNTELLEAQRKQFGIANDGAVAHATGEQLAEIASDTSVEVVVNAVVGFAGLPATIAAVGSGKRLGLANKESLIAAGPVVAKARAEGGGEIVPIDSEHSAIYQCLRAGTRSEVRNVILTASGGPFRGRSRAELSSVTVNEALAHPTWAMGPKITIDSSTLVNKGLEVIEAHELFGIGYDQIQVVVHPQSVVHSMVEFIDGAVIAQLSQPDMRLPIGLALGAPARLDQAFGAMDFSSRLHLDFEPPDTETFPALLLAYAAGRSGGTAPAILSAANEVAVDAFLRGTIRWTQIAETIDAALQQGCGAADTTHDVLVADAIGRQRALDHLRRSAA